MADKTVDERLDALEALADTDPEKVVRELQTIVATGNARAQCYLGACYEYGVGVPEDDKQAAEWYRKAAEQGYVLAQYRLGESYHRGRGVPKDLKQAAEWYRKAAEQGDEEAKKDLECIEIEASNGSATTAKFCAECGAALPAGAKFCANCGAKLSGTEQESAKQHFDKGIAYCREKEWDKAIAEYSAAIALEPETIPSYVNRGSVYLEKGDYDRAIADYDTVLKIKPDDAMTYNNRGWSYFMKGDWEKAVEDCTAAIKIEPNLPYAYDSRGEAYFAKGEYGKAVADFETAFKLNPEDNGYKKNLEKARAAAGPAGAKFCEECGAALPAGAKFCKNCGTKVAGTAPAIPAAAVNSPPPTNQALAGNRKLAEEHYERGEENAAEEYWPAAIEDYTKAIDLDPGVARYYAARGLAYEEQNMNEKAFEDNTQAVNLAGNDLFTLKYALCHRADLYVMADKKDLALADYRRAMAVGDLGENDPYPNSGIQEDIETWDLE
jgi:tetratricopeptide (TPR) repeat protein